MAQPGCESKADQVAFTFVGTGCSNALPNLRHVLQPGVCAVCDSGHADPNSKNARGTPSLLIQTDRLTLLVDCGKSFYTSASRVFPGRKVRGLDALLFTHGHMDAIGGLDNLREVQLASQPHDVWSLSTPTRVYCNEDTLDKLRQTFCYMFPETMTETEDAESRSGNRVVGLMEHCPVPEEVCDICIDGLQVTCLPVLHGGDYIALGFVFNSTFVYLSDVKSVPEATLQHLQGLALIDVLVVDALRLHESSYSHFSLDEALALVRLLRPKKAYIVGMSCEFDHDSVNKTLEAEEIPTELAYDGLSVVL